MPALSLRSGKAVVLTALLASLLGLLLLTPGAFALSGDDQYGAGFTGDDPGGGGGGGSDGSGSAPGGGSGSGSSGSGSSGSGSSSGGGSGSDSGSGSSGGLSLDSDSGGGGSGGSDSSGEAFGDAGGKKGRSVGELLSGTPTNPAATTDAGTRAAQKVGENSGVSGVVWLLLALGAITAVAGGGVAVRRRQARAGF